MINEKIYMSARLFRLFCENKNIEPKAANELFNLCGIWDYIDNAYEILHLNGDDDALSDIFEIMTSKGVLL